MENLKKPIPKIPSLDIGIESDIELGELVADTKLAAMQQGFDDRYQQGVTSFIQSQCEVESDQFLGTAAAALRLEERRQTLIEIAIQTGLFSVVSGCTALLVGFSPAQSAIVVFPSTIAAICVSKR
jgi:hypothetical protein